MNDGYELYCFQQLTEAAKVASQRNDEVTCVCAKYLKDEGYGNVPQQIRTNQLTS